MVRRRWAAMSLARAIAALILALFSLALFGCSSRAERRPGEVVRLQPGQRYRYVDHVTCRDAPGLERSSDGLLRLPRWGSNQPVLPVAAPGTISRRFVGPGPVFLETGFGVLPSGGGQPAGKARFVIRLVQRGRTRVLLDQKVQGPQGEEDPRWSPARIELSAEAVDEIEVQLAVEAVQGSAVWVNPVVVAPAAEQRPNLVLVVIDALRPDHLGCYGYARKTSPWVDRMAAGGVLFEDATSQATWTLPSVLSMLTSSYPLLVGTSQDVFRHENGHLVPLERVPMPVSLQGQLRALGYETTGSTGGGFLNSSFGFSNGFDWYWTPPTDKTTFLSDHLALLKSRLTAHRGEPFFLLLHTYEAHNYLQGWRHDVDEFSKGYAGRLLDKKVLYDTVTGGKAAGLSPADLQYLRDLYDGEIRDTDQQLGEFFDWLYAQPWGRDTIVVLTADHGESFAEHGQLHHGFIPYRELTNVPLIVHYPNDEHRGRKVRDMVTLADIMPSLVEAAGGKTAAGRVGQSFAPLVAGKAALPRASLTECRRPAVLNVREGRWTYLAWFDEDREEIYDVVADPAQKVNLARTRPAELEHMRRVLAREAMRAGRGYRVALSGRRPREIVLALASNAGFGYLLDPTSRRRPMLTGATSGKPGQEATVIVPAGGTPHVVLVAPTDPAAPLRIEARAGDRALPLSRFHLGADGHRPARLPLEILGPTGNAALASAAPPRSLESGEWGVWVWSLDNRPEAQAGAPGGIPEETRRQLRALGYVN